MRRKSEVRRVLQVSARDYLGGAEGVALSIHEELLRQRLISILAVGRKVSPFSSAHLIRKIGPKQSLLRQFCWEISQCLQSHPSLRPVSRTLEFLCLPKAWGYRQLGRENFESPGSRDLLAVHRPDIVHCHNLEGGFFDIRALREWSLCAPVILHLHDMWPLTGHCTHSFNCTRYQKGCGACPDLSIPPAIKRDQTAQNLRIKQEVFSGRGVYAIAPSRWMADCLQNSLIKVAKVAVIANGTDLSTFYPGDRLAARQALGLAPSATVLTCCGRNFENNPFKDFQTLKAALTSWDSPVARNATLLSLGSSDHYEDQFGSVSVKGVPFTQEPNTLRTYFQAADLHIHSARAETFGKVITEAMACHRAVLASDVGGILEIVRDLSRHQPEEATGLLAPPGDHRALVEGLNLLFSSETLRAQLEINSGRIVRENFSLSGQVDQIRDFYEECLEDWKVTVRAPQKC